MRPNGRKLECELDRMECASKPARRNRASREVPGPRARWFDRYGRSFIQTLFKSIVYSGLMFQLLVRLTISLCYGPSIRLRIWLSRQVAESFSSARPPQNPAF